MTCVMFACGREMDGKIIYEAIEGFWVHAQRGAKWMKVM